MERGEGARCWRACAAAAYRRPENAAFCFIITPRAPRAHLATLPAAALWHILHTFTLAACISRARGTHTHAPLLYCLDRLYSLRVLDFACTALSRQRASTPQQNAAASRISAGMRSFKRFAAPARSGEGRGAFIARNRGAVCAPLLNGAPAVARALCAAKAAVTLYMSSGAAQRGYITCFALRVTVRAMPLLDYRPAARRRRWTAAGEAGAPRGVIVDFRGDGSRLALIAAHRFWHGSRFLVSFSHRLVSFSGLRVLCGSYRLFCF